MPSRPSQTARTAAVFVTIVKTNWLASATSRGLSPQRPPASISQSAFSRVRFQTVSVWPASSSRFATPPPMTPRPTKPTSATLRPRLPGTPDVALDALDVLVHPAAGDVGPPIADCLEDQPMHLDRAARAARDVVDARQRPLKKAADRLHQVSRDPVPARLGDRHVEPEVGVDERLLGAEAFDHRVNRLVHAVEVLALPTGGGEGGTLALEEPTHLEQLGHVRFLRLEEQVERTVERVRQTGDPEGARPVALDQTAGLEHAQRLPYGRPANSEVRDELALGRQEIAGLEDARADLLRQPFGDELVRLTAQDRL